MARKPLEWSARARVEIEDIVAFYAKEASPIVAEAAYISIISAAEVIAANPLAYRAGVRAGTHEYVMRRFPYTLVDKVADSKVFVVRVMHQAAKYFN